MKRNLIYTKNADIILPFRQIFFSGRKKATEDYLFMKEIRGLFSADLFRFFVLWFLLFPLFLRYSFESNASDFYRFSLLFLLFFPCFAIFLAFSYLFFLFYYNTTLCLCQVYYCTLCYHFYMISIYDIQKRLRDAIASSSLSQKQIAVKLGVNPSTISKYIRLDKFPSLETFANLCFILDVSADDILGLIWFLSVDLTKPKFMRPNNSVVYSGKFFFAKIF